MAQVKIAISKKIGEMFHHEHKDKYSRVNPQKQWKRIVITYSAITALLLAFSGYVYLQVTTGEFFAVAPVTSNTVTTLNREKLNSTVSFFEAKREKFDEEKSKTPDSVDPRF